jgi:hypothetical protein
MHVWLHHGGVISARAPNLQHHCTTKRVSQLIKLSEIAKKGEATGQLTTFCPHELQGEQQGGAAHNAATQLKLACITHATEQHHPDYKRAIYRVSKRPPPQGLTQQLPARFERRNQCTVRQSSPWSPPGPLPQGLWPRRASRAEILPLSSRPQRLARLTALYCSSCFVFSRLRSMLQFFGE